MKIELTDVQKAGLKSISKDIAVEATIHRAIDVYLSIHRLPPKERGDIFCRLIEIEFERFQFLIDGADKDGN